MRIPSFTALLTAVLLLGACGSTATTTQGAAPTSASPTPQAQDTGGVALTGGDIPDTQQFLAYPAPGAPSVGFTIQYPEGWAQAARSDGVTFIDRDNTISVTIRSGSPATVDSLRQEVAAIKGAAVTTAAHALSLAGGSAVEATYQVDGQANAVSGKKPRLTVDRYELSQGGRVAVLELATPVGVNNVDAYRMLAGSFRWR